MAYFATVKIDLFDPVDLAGAMVHSLELREPRAGDYAVTGPVLQRVRRGALQSTFELFEITALYIRRGIVGMSEREAKALLDAMSLTDTFRIIRAFSPMIPGASIEDVRFCQSSLVFDWRMMSVSEADDLSVSELFYTVERLNEHNAQRAKRRK